VPAAINARVSDAKTMPGRPARHHGAASATRAAGMASATAISTTSTASTSTGGAAAGPVGPACRRALIINGTTSRKTASWAAASAVKNTPAMPSCAPARLSALFSPPTASAGSLARPGTDNALNPLNRPSGTGRSSAVSTVGARSTSCR
jgi:hypothetical protein